MSAADSWSDFFVASAGALAALAGLVIVAVSVNVKAILKYPALPERTAATIGLLVLTLVSVSAGLIKTQPLRALGAELLAFALLGWIPQLLSVRAAGHITPQPPWPRRAFALLSGQVVVILVLAAGILLAAADPSGYYLVAAAVISGYVVAILNAWVLLVEILR
jgi:hypothetical protein